MICPSALPEHDDFDWHQSSDRMAIECAFGILVQRWGVLWRPLRCRFNRRAPLIGACIRLHNFCIDQGLDEEHLAAMNGDEFMLPGDGAVAGRWRTTPRFEYGRPVD